MDKVVGVFVLSLLSFAANATLLTGEIAEDAYVTYQGYDLAWASPCSDGILESSCDAIDMTEQSGYGWEIMTSSLFDTLGISASTFIVDYSSANTEFFGGNNYAKASSWFTGYSHIDVIDGLNGRWSFADVAEVSWYETIVYRTAEEANVPEPGLIGLLSLGLIGLGLARRKVKA